MSGSYRRGEPQTHGGFYRHFGSKDDLFVDEITLSFREVGDRLERAAQAAPEGGQTATIIGAYLSKEHLKEPETWCALAHMTGADRTWAAALTRS